ncbi:hypothetical protein bb8_p02 [Bordetella phage vB_BbrP_BB8]|uniref:Uncharacterized protein n=1 Tax=Bordetella phage vB_BbrP_BB8 TaxID=2587820 RepID=A0A4Y5TNM8_9CAUD|nr:hypothetical protein bb8_p02 [Bordetella phage vB_BbrP_BB8]
MTTLLILLLSLPYLFFAFLFGYAVWHALGCPGKRAKGQPKG